MKEDNDNAEPAASSIAARNLLRLAQIRDSKELRGASRRKRSTPLPRSLNHYPSAMPQMLVALDFSLTKPKQIIIAGQPGAADTRELLEEVHRHYLPNTIVLLADGGEGPEISRRETGGDEGDEADRRESGGLCLRELHLQSAGDLGGRIAQAAESLGGLAVEPRFGLRPSLRVAAYEARGHKGRSQLRRRRRRLARVGQRLATAQAHPVVPGFAHAVLRA